MKTSLKNNKYGQDGYTAGEMIIACGVLVILGLAFFQVLNSGMILYAKNTAVNSAHEQAREAINRLTRDIHASVSVPQLRNSTHDGTYSVAGSFPTPTPAPAGTVTYAAGVSFQNVTPGNPNFVWKDPGSDTKIMLKDNPNPPTAGMRLIVPFWGIEDDIARVDGATAQHSNVVTANAMETILAKKAPLFSGGDAYAITYSTDLGLVVVEG